MKIAFHLPFEFLDLCGRLVGMPKADRRVRSEEMIDKVGLRHAVDRPIGKFSKGMMQRIGLAQALLHDPELLVLDEPMSGLDPIGRKEVRDLLIEQRERVNVATVGLETAEEELRVSEERFRLRAASMLDVIYARVAYSQARVSLVEAQYDYEIAKAELKDALGL